MERSRPGDEEQTVGPLYFCTCPTISWQIQIRMIHTKDSPLNPQILVPHGENGWLALRDVSFARGRNANEFVTRSGRYLLIT